MKFKKRDKQGRPIWFDEKKVVTAEFEIAKEDDQDQNELLNFNKMTKDQINDYANDNGFGDEINTNITKKEMISKLKELIE
jgi:hypothetical protein